MYVKEDIILPSTITFYDLIATRARGKSGPLFSFDVHDDVRYVVGARCRWRTPCLPAFFAHLTPCFAHYCFI